MVEDPGESLIRATIGTLAAPVRDFLSKVLGVPAAELGELLGDEIRFWRWRNAVRLLTRAQEIADERGLDPQIVPGRVFFPVLESASMEDEPEMAERWASLLATAATEPDLAAPSYPQVLRQLEPVEARLLDQLDAARPNRDNWPISTFALEQLAEYESVEWRHLDNLERLGLITYDPELPGNAEIPDRPPGRTRIVDTSYGAAFVQACQGGEAPRRLTPGS